MRDCLICILSFLIGVLLWGYVIIFTHSSQYTINLGNLSDWFTSLATVGLLLCAIIGFGSWKKQKKPEATIDLLKALENLQVKMNKEYSFILKKLENSDPDKENIIEKIHQKLLDCYCNYYEYEYFDKHFQKKLKKYTRFNGEKGNVPEEIKFEYATELFQRISWRYIRVMVKEITGKPLTLGVSAQHLRSKNRLN